MLPSGYQPAELPGAAGPVIVLEGVSGVGKSTLAETLERRLAAVRLHTLPLPHNTWSRTVNSRLAPLPQFAFYLSGALHASDFIRGARTCGPVVADRYLSSVIACHAAVHELLLEDVRRMLEPYRSYFAAPDFTFYLRCSEDELRERMRVKSDRKQDDVDLFSVPGRLPRLLKNFERVAADDPSAVVVDTDDKSPDDIAKWILAYLEARGA
jgi:dTMP kinase